MSNAFFISAAPSTTLFYVYGLHCGPFGLPYNGIVSRRRSGGFLLWSGSPSTRMIVLILTMTVPSSGTVKFSGWDVETD